MLFRRWEYKLLDESFVRDFVFDWRPVGRNTIRMNVSAVLLKQWDRVDTHIVLYHRYATWQRYLVNVWEDFCNVFGASKLSPIGYILHNNFNKYTNIRHPCPYRVNETVWLRTSAYNFSSLTIPLLSSGQYRVDVTFANGKQRQSVFFGRLYFEVSDHRVWTWKK